MKKNNERKEFLKASHAKSIGFPCQNFPHMQEGFLPESYSVKDYSHQCKMGID